MILGFFLLFARRMPDHEFLLAVLVYFMYPMGFGMAPLLYPLSPLSNEAEAFR